MSARSLRLLETSLVSAFVSFGVAAAVLHAAEPSPPAAVCEPSDPLEFLLSTAVAADVGLFSDDAVLDDVEAYRVESLYAWYVAEHEKLAASSSPQWAQNRVDALQQLQKDLAEMKKLEKEAMALEAARNHE